MSLYLNEKVDPIAAAGGRELNFIPKHFHCVNLNSSFYDFRGVRRWIWLNQTGRFYVGSRIKANDSHMTSENVAAFEDAGEAIMFSFILPTLQNNIFDDFI